MSSTVWGLIAAGVVVAIGWLLIRAAMKSARDAGSAEERADATADAREAEQEMTDITMQPTSPEETKDKLKKGEF